MRTKALAGFTIVELLIVIVVIAILAAISLVAFNGVQTRADNAARASEFTQWHKIMQAYYAVNGHYPPALDTIGDYCLGTGFPGGRCLSTGLESNSVELMDQLATISNLPSGPRERLYGHYAGPFIRVNSDGFAMRTVLTGKEGVCESFNLIHDFTTENKKHTTCAIGFFD